MHRPLARAIVNSIHIFKLQTVKPSVPAFGLAVPRLQCECRKRKQALRKFCSDLDSFQVVVLFLRPGIAFHCSSSLWPVPFRRGLTPSSLHWTDSHTWRTISGCHSPCSSLCSRFRHSRSHLQPSLLPRQTNAYAFSDRASAWSLRGRIWSYCYRI